MDRDDSPRPSSMKNERHAHFRESGLLRGHVATGQSVEFPFGLVVGKEGIHPTAQLGVSLPQPDRPGLFADGPECD
jgi:hypothetical protein